MSSVIKIKRSDTSGSVPSGLEVGEIAVNLFDRKLYVGNTASGVSTIGGEDFRFTTQTAGEGAYLKLNGDSVLSTNTVLVRGGADITVGKDANGSISVSTSTAFQNEVDAKATWAALTATNTAIRAITTQNASDIAANATEIGDVWSGLIATNTAIRSLTTANANEIGDVWTGLLATNTAIRALTTTNANKVAQVESNLLSTNTSIRSAISALETNVSQKLGGTASVTLSGDVAGSASFSANAVTISTSIQNNSVDLGTHTTGNYAAAVTGTTNEVEVSGTAGEGTTFQIGLPSDVTIGNDLTINNDASVGGDLTVSGGLTVTGSLTYLSTSTVYTDDGMMKLSANNAGDATDTGIYAKYIDGATAKYAGYFRDADDGVFKFYKENQSEPTTTVDTGGTGYALAQVDCVIDGGSY